LHDLSNQLMPLIGYLPLLEKHANDENRVADYLDKMKNSAQLAPQLVREIQEMARQLFPGVK